MIEVKKATEQDIARFYHGAILPGNWIGYAAKRGRRVLAAGGMVEVEDGEWYGFLDVPKQLRTPMAFRYAVKLMKQASGQGAKIIKATCDESIPGAETFLKRLGFTQTEQEFEGRNVWYVRL